MAVTDFASIRAHVFERFDLEVRYVEDTPTQFPNAQFERPNSGPLIELRLDQQEAEQKSFGSPDNNRFDIEGTLEARVFHPIGQGTARQQTIIDTIRAAFESETQNGISWRSAKVVEVGRAQNDWLFTVTIPFTAHIYK